jgi:hypothetical protein
LIKYHLRAAAEAAQVLGVDADQAARWQEIADRMAPYPLYETPEGPIFSDVAGAPPLTYNIPVPLSALFWGDDLDLNAPPDPSQPLRMTLLQEIARRTARQIQSDRLGNVNVARARLGIPVERCLQSYLQSTHDLLRVFPAVPEGLDVRIERLRAQGAFLVDGEYAQGRTRWVRIQSEAGATCTLVSPWGDAGVRVVRAGSGERVPTRREGNLVIFETVAGEVYEVTSEAPAR